MRTDLVKSESREIDRLPAALPAWLFGRCPRSGLGNDFQLDQPPFDGPREIVLGIWEALLSTPPEQLTAIAEAILPRIAAPLLSLHGSSPPPDYAAWLTGLARGARVGIIENQQQLAFFDGIALFDKNMAHAGRDRSVGLEVVHRLNFSVGGNQAANRTLFNDGGSHLNRIIAMGDESGHHNHGPEDGKRRQPPAPRRASRTVSIQWHAEKSASFNVSSAPSGSGQFGVFCSILFVSASVRSG